MSDSTSPWPRRRTHLSRPGHQEHCLVSIAVPAAFGGTAGIACRHRSGARHRGQDARGCGPTRRGQRFSRASPTYTPSAPWRSSRRWLDRLKAWKSWFKDRTECGCCHARQSEPFLRRGPGASAANRKRRSGRGAASGSARCSPQGHRAGPAARRIRRRPGPGPSHRAPCNWLTCWRRCSAWTLSRSRRSWRRNRLRWRCSSFSIISVTNRGCWSCATRSPAKPRRKSTRSSATIGFVSNCGPSRTSSVNRSRTRRKSPSCGERMQEAELPEHVRKEAGPRIGSDSSALPSAAPDFQLTRTYLELILELPWKKSAASSDRLAGREESARCRPLRLGENQGANSRTPGSSQIKSEGESADLVPRRTAGRGQDLARPIDRAGDGSPIRALEPWRHARRVRVARPPADVYRRHAGAVDSGDPPAPA